MMSDVRWMMCKRRLMSEGGRLRETPSVPLFRGRKGCRVYFYLLSQRNLLKYIKNYCSLDERRLISVNPARIKRKSFDTAFG